MGKTKSAPKGTYLILTFSVAFTEKITPKKRLFQPSGAFAGKVCGPLYSGRKEARVVRDRSAKGLQVTLPDLFISLSNINRFRKIWNYH